MGSHSTIFESLEREFCPPLDSSLLAAFLSDIVSDDEGKAVEPSSSQIDELRAALTELAVQADVTQLSEEFFDVNDSVAQSLFSDDLSATTPSFTLEGDTSTATSSSNGSDSPRLPFNTPLGFLQAALPHIRTEKLSKALSDAELEEEEVDMWEVIAGLLSDESVREMLERGLEGLEAEDRKLAGIGDDDTAWKVVGGKASSKPRPPMTSKKKTRGSKITLGDVRQQQHVRPQSRPNPKNASSVSAPAPDPWTQVSSISSYLSLLLAPRPATFFQSYFHSPEHVSPYTALCAALTNISQPQSQSPTTSEEDQSHSEILISLLDILLPSYDDLDSEQRSRLIDDAQLSLTATHYRGEDALELVKLLRDLDSDSFSGDLELGVYHQPATAPASTPKSPIGSRAPKLPSGPPPILPPPISRAKNTSPPGSPSRNKPSPHQWQKVPQRKLPYNTPHPLAAHIPAYARDVNGMAVRGSGNGVGKGGKGDVGELQAYQTRMGESMRKRNEMLREATKMWQRGNARTRGGEVALYFAERAREFQELARKDALNVARMIVESKRVASQDQDTVDLHGTTVSEAIEIAKETLKQQNCSPAKPVKIITGRGAHSTNQISVLKPAVRKALVEEGWNVTAWDGGLTVRGKKR